MGCDACSTIPAVKSDYTPNGSIEKVAVDNDSTIDMYTTGNVNSERVIIIVYDIFGFHNNTKQFADLLAKQAATGFRVVMPDFLRGSYWPQPGYENVRAWIQAAATYEKVGVLVKAVIAHCKKQTPNMRKFGMVGFCWGAKMAILESNNNGNAEIGAAALIHPSLLDNEDAERAQCPLLVVPTKQEPPLEPFMQILREKKPQFADKCIHFRFDDVHHGFCAARGDWNDPLQAQRVCETIQLTADFFHNNL